MEKIEGYTMVFLGDSFGLSGLGVIVVPRALLEDFLAVFVVQVEGVRVHALAVEGHVPLVFF